MNRVKGGYQTIKLKENYSLAGGEITGNDKEQFRSLINYVINNLTSGEIKNISFKTIKLDLSYAGEHVITDGSIVVSDDFVAVYIYAMNLYNKFSIQIGDFTSTSSFDDLTITIEQQQ